MHGDVNLAPNGYGWASGGYIADSRISGVEGQYSQQQWFTRDSQIGSNSNAVWNQEFVGVQGAPATSFPLAGVHNHRHRACHPGEALPLSGWRRLRGLCS